MCRDIFEYHEGDGSRVPDLWDVWDRYAATFQGAGRLEWIPEGHEHMEGYLGTHGGFPIFVGACRYPLLVEAGPDDIRYRWILKPTADDPLRETVEALNCSPVTSWQVAVVPKGAPLAVLPDALEPDGVPASGISFRQTATADGSLDLGGIPGLGEGDRAIAVATYPLGRGYHNRHALLRRDLPFTVWINGTRYETAAGTGGRTHAYMMEKRGVNRAVVQVEMRGGEGSLCLVPTTFPPDLAAASVQDAPAPGAK